MAPSDFDTSLAALKALADATRLQLLGLIAQQDRTVGELATVLRLKEPTISHHLARLLDCGLVTMRTSGTAHYYRLDAEALQRVGKAIADPRPVASPELGSAVDSWERKTLRTFVHGTRLTKIPDTRKKRDVILRWLVTQFDPDTRYSEAQVNTMLKRVHEDIATLRRELIMAKLMQRENNVYWRTT